MRRTIALLVGAAAVLVVAARPVAAAPDAPANSAAQGSVATTSAPGNAVPADAVDLALSQVVGSGLAVTLDPGASEEHDIVVSNHTANLRLTVKLTATDATGKVGAAAASWLAFGDDAIQLDPHAAVTVPMTIAVPHDTQPGSALAHVSATVESAVSAADGSPVAGTASRTFPGLDLGPRNGDRADRDRRRAPDRSGLDAPARGRVAQLRRSGRAGERPRARRR